MTESVIITLIICLTVLLSILTVLIALSIIDYHDHISYHFNDFKSQGFLSSVEYRIQKELEEKILSSLNQNDKSPKD